MKDVEVVGLDALVADLASIKPDFLAAGRAVGEIVKRASVGRANSRQMSRVVGGNRYTPNVSGLNVTLGGNSGDQRWALGAQFGSRRFSQFPQWREPGYTVIPAIDDNAQKISELIADAVLKQMQ